MLKRIFKNRIALHVYWWMAVYVLFFHLVNIRESENLQWSIFLYFFFIPLPVDLHFFILHHFFKRKKYFLYVSFLITIIVLMTLLTNIYNITFLHSPDSLLKNSLEVILIIIIATALKIVKDGFRQKIQLQEIESRHLQTEMQLLKSQVNPHFLFNTLNNLYSLSLDNSDKLPQMIQELVGLMSYMIESSGNQKVSLKKEIGFIESYLTLEKMRLPSGSDIRFIVDGDPDRLMIAPMLFIPLVENCFTHGAKATAGNFFIHIHFIIKKNRLQFITKNNPGSKNPAYKNGTGLNNVRRRLELLYPEHHNLYVKSKTTSFMVFLEIYQ